MIYFFGFNPNPGFTGYPPAGYKFFPGRLTGTVGMDLRWNGDENRDLLVFLQAFSRGKIPGNPAFCA
jgi:hypothetical protein